MSLDHRPIFLMSSLCAPANFNAIAPPARREWVPMRSGVMPLDDKPSLSTAAFSARLMSSSVMCALPRWSQYVDNRSVCLALLSRRWMRRRAKALTGQNFTDAVALL